MIETISNNPNQVGNALLIPDVTFSKVEGTELKMQIFVPWAFEINPSLRFPTVVFLQGSGWTSPNVNYELPQLAALARQGYVVATITHRSYLDGFALPTFLKDSKTAIRFLRQNAEKYGVDPNRFGFWGTSSGGNTAQLIALTGDDPVYQTEEWPEASDAVTCAVSCFGPSDLGAMYQENLPELERMVNGSIEKQQDLIHAISPIKILDQRKTACPIFLLHGTEDQLVDCRQSKEMFDQLNEAGIETQLLLVEGANHEGDFWSEKVYQRIFQFLGEKLQ